MINCKRCNLEITFDESRCLSASTGQPHDIRKCKTKPGYVYCPKCRDTFPRTNACTHYLTYGWKFNQNEEFVLDLIQQNYVDGDWFNRRNNRKVSGDKMKERQYCKKCKKTFPANFDASKMSLHEKVCSLQQQLI